MCHLNPSLPLSLMQLLQDTNVLPIYAEIIGGQPNIAKPASAIVVAPRSRPHSGVPLGAISNATSSSGSGSIVLQGLYRIKETGLFAGWLWKDRWVSLNPQALIIHRQGFKVCILTPSPLALELTRCPLLFPFTSYFISIIHRSFDHIGIARFKKDPLARSHTDRA